jgi:SAM-dependent methyltransferase
MMETKEVIFKIHHVAEMGNDNVNTFLSERKVFEVINRIIHTFLPPPLSNYSLIDLGCMEGGYSLTFAKMGFQTTGLDARKENLFKANMLKLGSKIPNLNFVLDDARNIEQHGQFDITFCFGLLYHLDDPAAFLKKVHNSTNKMLILHSYCAPEKGWAKRYWQLKLFKKYFKAKIRRFQEEEAKKEKHLGYIQYPINRHLSPTVSINEGYKGRWFEEYNEKVSQADIEKMPGASYNNHRSFWFFKGEMIRALYDAGFKSVFEVHDDMGDLRRDNPDMYFPRTLLVAMK